MSQRLLHRLISLLSILGILCVSTAAFAADYPYCAGIDGTWKFSGSGNTEQLNCTGLTSCTLTFTSGGNTCNMTYALSSVTYDGTSNLYYPYTATYVSGTCGTVPWTGRLTMISTTGCIDVYDSKYAAYLYRTAGLNSVATGETQYGYTLYAEIPGTISGGTATGGEAASIDKGLLNFPTGRQYGELFGAKLVNPKDSPVEFAGRTVKEVLSSNNNKTPICTSLDPLPSAGGVVGVYTNVEWSVGGDSNNWDYVGEFPDYQNAIAYAALMRRQYIARLLTLPCYHGWHQEMQIDTPDGTGGITWVPFQENDIYIEVTAADVYTNRNNTAVRWQGFGESVNQMKWENFINMPIIGNTPL